MEKVIEEYLIGLEKNLLNVNIKKPIVFSKEWVNTFPDSAGVYILRRDDKICYVGEASSLRSRMYKLTTKHVVRWKIAKNDFWEKHGKFDSKNIPEEVKFAILELLSKDFELSFIEVPFGRKELEQRIIDKYSPIYNTIGKKKKGR